MLMGRILLVIEFASHLQELHCFIAQFYLNGHILKSLAAAQLLWSFQIQEARKINLILQVTAETESL